MKLTEARPMTTETVNLAVTIELGYFTKEGRASAMRAIRHKINGGFVDAGQVLTFAHAAKLRIMHPRLAVQCPGHLHVYPKGSKKPSNQRRTPRLVLVVNAC